MIDETLSIIRYNRGISILNWLTLRTFIIYRNFPITGCLYETFTLDVGAALVMHYFLVIDNSIITVNGSLLRLEGVVPLPDERCLISHVKLHRKLINLYSW